MKRLLSILASVGLTATVASTVVSCADTNTTNPNMDFGKPSSIFDNSDTTLSNAKISDDGMTITVETSKKPKVEVTQSDVVIVRTDSETGKKRNTWCSNVKTKIENEKATIIVTMLKPAYEDEDLGIYIDGFKNTEALNVNTDQCSSWAIDAYSDYQMGPVDNEGVFNRGLIKVSGIKVASNKGGSLTSDNLLDDLEVTYSYDDEVNIYSAKADGDGTITIEFLLTESWDGHWSPVSSINVVGKNILKNDIQININNSEDEPYIQDNGISSIPFDVSFGGASTLVWRAADPYHNKRGDNCYIYIEKKDGTTSTEEDVYSTFDGGNTYHAKLQKPLEDGDSVRVLNRDAFNDDLNPNDYESTSVTYNGPAAGWAGED